MSEIISEYSPAKYNDATLEHVLKGKKHPYSQFTDVNGKGRVFEGYDFSYCVFVRAYFHNATFSGCKFIGAHFVDCNFRNAQIRGCDFSYATLSGSKIPTNQILNNLPDRPNVRRELLQILRRNAMSIGDYDAEKTFVVREIDAKKEHYRLVSKRPDSYHQNKYSFWQAVWHRIKYHGLQLDWLLWGHGERLWIAPIALVILLAALSLCLAAQTFTSIPNPTFTIAVDLFWIAFVYHSNLFLGLPVDQAGIKGLMWIDWLLVITRYVAIGVLVAALYRRLSHR